MNKKSIDSLIKKSFDIESKALEIRDMLGLIQSLTPKDFPHKLEREQAKESAEEAENIAINLLLEINKMTEEMVKKIDPESWKEYKND